MYLSYNYKGNPKAIKFHTMCVDATEIEYRKQYKMFDVLFDVWERESTHRNVTNLLKDFEERNLLETEGLWFIAKVPCLKVFRKNN